MNCPYCNRTVNGMTGFQEIQKFQKHLNQCRKNPKLKFLTDGRKTVFFGPAPTMIDALNIRAESGQ